MPKYNENEILQRLKLLSQLKPTSQATKRAIENVRQTLVNEPKREQIQHANIWHVIIKSPATKLAAAAVIIIAVGLFLVHRGPDEQIKPTEVAKVTKSPAELTTFASLTFAYRRGGMKALEKQFEKAEKKVRPGLAERITIDQLICELEGC